MVSVRSIVMGIAAVALSGVLVAILLNDKYGASCEAPTPRAMPNRAGDEQYRAINNRLDRIRHVLEQSHKISADDHKFVVSSLDRPQGITAPMALLMLGEELEAGLLPRTQFLAITERMIDTAVRGRGVIYLNEYKRGLGLGRVPDPQWSGKVGDLVFPKNRDGGSFDQRDRDFVDRALLEQMDENRILAGDIFVWKRGLGSGDLGWVLGKLEEQIRSSDAKVRPYWQLVRRVVMFRNAPRPIKFESPVTPPLKS